MNRAPINARGSDAAQKERTNAEAAGATFHQGTMKTKLIITLGHEDYLLDDSVTVEQAHAALFTLSKGMRKTDHQYIDGPGYERVQVVQEQPIDVGIKMTMAPILTREEYAKRQEQASKTGVAAS